MIMLPTELMLLAMLQPPMPPEMPFEVMLLIRDVVQTVFISLAVMVVGFPVARAFGRRIDRKSQPAAVSPDVSSRLERIEQAVDAMAVEIERISEGQRFVTRLLTEGGRPVPQLPAGAGRSPGSPQR